MPSGSALAECAPLPDPEAAHRGGFFVPAAWLPMMQPVTGSRRRTLFFLGTWEHGIFRKHERLEMLMNKGFDAPKSFGNKVGTFWEQVGNKSRIFLNMKNW